MNGGIVPPKEYWYREKIMKTILSNWKMELEKGMKSLRLPDDQRKTILFTLEQAYHRGYAAKPSMAAAACTALISTRMYSTRTQERVCEVYGVSEAGIRRSLGVLTTLLGEKIE